MQQIQQNLALNKCPHGFPVGTCPICSGHGGASKDKNKPRVAGEMSYNECMAVWMKMQAAKDARIQERIDKIQAARENLILNRIMAGLIEKIDNIQKFLDKAIEKIPSYIKTPITAAINLIQNIAITTVKAAVIIYNNLSNFVLSVSEKLASIYGEVKNFIVSELEKKFKKPIKIILTFFAQSEGEDEEDKKKIEDLLKRIKNLIKIKRKKKENKRHAPD